MMCLVSDMNMSMSVLAMDKWLVRVINCHRPIRLTNKTSIVCERMCTCRLVFVSYLYDGTKIKYINLYRMVHIVFPYVILYYGTCIDVNTPVIFDN